MFIGGVCFSLFRGLISLLAYITKISLIKCLAKLICLGWCFDKPKKCVLFEEGWLM